MTRERILLVNVLAVAVCALVYELLCGTLASYLLGDEVLAKDFVHAPHTLSVESAPDEISWSRGTYLPPDAVMKAFGKRVLPKPVGRAPNQPRPSRRT